MGRSFSEYGVAMGRTRVYVNPWGGVERGRRAQGEIWYCRRIAGGNL